MPIKKALTVAALVTAALVVAILTFVYLYGLNGFKPMIAGIVEDATGRQLKIEGDIRILPTWPPTLTAEQVTFQNAIWGSRPQMISVARISAAISVLPILRGEYRLVHVHASGVEVDLEFDSSGVSNFLMDVGRKSEIPAIPVLAINDIRIIKSQIRYHDQKSGLQLSLDVDRLKADIPGLNRSIRADIEGRFRGLPFSLHGGIGPITARIEPEEPLSVNLTAGLGAVTAQIEGAIHRPISLKGVSLKLSANGSSTRELTNLFGATDMPDLGKFGVRGELTDESGQLGIKGLTAEIASQNYGHFTMHGSVDNLADMQGMNFGLHLKADNPAFLQQAGFPAPLVDGSLVVSAGFSDPAKRRYRLDDIRVTLGHNRLAGRLDLNLAQELPVLNARIESRETTFGHFALDTRISGTFDRISVERLELKMEKDNLGRAILGGSISNLNALEGVALNFLVLGDDLAELRELAGRPLPVRGPFSASGSLFSTSPRTLRIPELKIILGRNKVRGSLELDLEGPDPQLAGTFESRRLNVERLMAPDLLPTNLSGSLSSLESTRLRFRLSRSPDDLELRRIEFQTRLTDIAGLSCEGSIGDLLDFNSVDLNFMIQGNELANLKKATGHSIPLEGPFSLSAELKDNAEKTYRFDAVTFSAGMNTFTGFVIADFSEEIPVVTAEVATPRFNLQKFTIGQNPILERLKTVEDLGPIDVKTTVSYSGQVIALQNLELSAGNDSLVRLQVEGSAADLSGLKNLNLRCKASGLDIKRLELFTGRKLPLHGSYQASGHISDPSPKNIKFSDLEFSWDQNRFNGWINLNLSGSHPVVEADLSADHIRVETLDISAVDPLKDIPDLGPLNLSFKLTHSDESQKVHHLDFRMGSEETIAVTLQGSVKNLVPLSGVNIDFFAGSRDLTILKDAYYTRYVNKLPIRLTGRLESRLPGDYTISSFQAAYGDSDLSGSVSLNLGNDRPDFRARLSSRRLDLRSFLKSFRQEANPQGPPKKTPGNTKRIFSRDPLPLDVLNRLNTDIEFQGRELLLTRTAYQDVGIHVRLENGELYIDPLKFTIGGGTAEGSIALLTGPGRPTLTTGMNVQKFDIGPMLKQLGLASTLKGSLDTTFHLESSGDNIADLMAGLDGTIYLNISKGQIQNAHLNSLARYLGGNVFELLNPFKKKATHTKINCLVNRVDIKAGDAEYTLVLDTPQTALLVAGTIDLKTEKLDIAIKPTPKKGFGHEGVGTVSFSLKELSQPFKLGGTLANPSLEMDPKRTLLTAGKFAGAMALGPGGIAFFFSDISSGKKNICAEADKNMRIGP